MLCTSRTFFNSFCCHSHSKVMPVLLNMLCKVMSVLLNMLCKVMPVLLNVLCKMLNNFSSNHNPQTCSLPNAYLTYDVTWFIQLINLPLFMDCIKRYKRHGIMYCRMLLYKWIYVQVQVCVNAQVQCIIWGVSTVDTLLILKPVHILICKDNHII